MSGGAADPQSSAAAEGVGEPLSWRLRATATRPTRAARLHPAQRPFGAVRGGGRCAARGRATGLATGEADRARHLRRIVWGSCGPNPALSGDPAAHCLVLFPGQWEGDEPIWKPRQRYP